MKSWIWLPLLLGCTAAEKTNDSASDTSQDSGDESVDTGPFDSDGDGHLDGEELESGCNPEADEGTSYTGGWPTNPNPATHPGWEEEGDVNQTHPRFCGSDQYTDLVDLYDLGGQDKDVVIDVSTLWCTPCQRIALWIEDGDETHLHYQSDPETGEPVFYPWYYEEMQVIPELVQSGAISWVTILVQDENHEAPTQDTIDQWNAAFPSERVPVLLDNEQRIYDWMKNTGYPTINVVDENMVFQTYTNRGGNDAFAYLVALASE